MARREGMSLEGMSREGTASLTPAYPCTPPVNPSTPKEIWLLS